MNERIKNRRVTDRYTAIRWLNLHFLRRGTSLFALFSYVLIVSCYDNPMVNKDKYRWIFWPWWKFALSVHWDISGTKREPAGSVFVPRKNWIDTIQQHFTSSSAVAKRPRDVSCLSVVSFNSTIPQAQFLPRDAMQARPMSSCGVCLSVCHVRELCQNE